jgi:hypothetical protein
MWFLDQRHAPHCAFLELNEPSHEIRCHSLLNRLFDNFKAFQLRLVEG